MIREPPTVGDLSPLSLRVRMASVAFTGGVPCGVRTSGVGFSQAERRWVCSPRRQGRPRFRPPVVHGGRCYSHAGRSDDLEEGGTEELLPAAAKTPADVPRSLEEVMNGAANSLRKALDSGLNRLKVTVLLPGLNPKLENSFPYNEELLFYTARGLASRDIFGSSRLSLLYASDGTAASARAYYERIGLPVADDVSFGATTARDVRTNDTDGAGDAYLIVQPKNLRGDAVILDVEKMVKKAPRATFILLNPFMEDTEMNLVNSIVEIDRQRVLLQSFQEAYHLRPLYYIRRPTMEADEIGMVLMYFGSTWQVYSGAGDLISLVEEFDEPPSRAQVTGAIEQSQSLRRSVDEIASRQQAAAAEKDLFVLLGALSLIVSGLAAYLLRFRQAL